MRIFEAWVQGGTLTPDMAEEIPVLSQLGFSWIVQFRMPNHPTEEQKLTEQLTSLFGTPTHREELLNVWKIQ